VSQTTDVQSAARDYLAAGFRLVAIPAGSKGPTHKGWNTPAGCVTDPDTLDAGVGLAHAFSRTAALDFDDFAAASEGLNAHGVDVSALWTAPDAVRISSGRSNRGKLVYRLPPGVAPLPTKKIAEGRRTLFELRCATANGATVQDVLPPSIHPGTGQPYAWEYGDPLLGHWSDLPELPPAVLTLWQSLTARPEPAEADDFARLGLTPGQMRDALRHVDPSTGYDDWLKAGMACHHESAGQPYGLDVWDEWSSASDKYPGRDALEAKWDSFGRERSTVVTGRWLMAQAGVATPDDFEDLSTPADPNAPRFAFVPAPAFATGKPLSWLIKGVLPQAGLGVIYGESGSGKSFFALDLAAHIVAGVEWRGRKTRKGRGAYVVAEGAAGFRLRIQAHAQLRGMALDDLFVCGDAPSLLVAKDVSDLVAALQALGPLDFVIVDTLAQTMAGGNENASEDMGKAIKHCRSIHDATGAIVLLVHHSGKDASKGARGHSSLRAASDVEIEVTRGEDDTRAAELSKVKDGRDKERFGFTLQGAMLGTDEDGEPITSAVVEHCDAPPPAAPGRPAGDDRNRPAAAYETLRAYLLLQGASSMPVADARKLLAESEPFASIDSKKRATRVAEALTSLSAKGRILIEAGLLALC
jgi:hypothetical protein